MPKPSSLQALAASAGRLRWLSAILVAVLAASAFDSGWAGVRFVETTITGGTRLAADEPPRTDIARPETQLGPAKPARQAAPEPTPDEPAAGFLHAADSHDDVATGKQPAGGETVARSPVRFPAQSRGPPSPAPRT